MTGTKYLEFDWLVPLERGCSPKRVEFYFYQSAGGFKNKNKKNVEEFFIQLPCCTGVRASVF